jgi:hypothetical protein
VKPFETGTEIQWSFSPFDNKTQIVCRKWPFENGTSGFQMVTVQSFGFSLAAGKKMNSSSGALNQAKKLFQTNEVSHISVTKTSVTDTSEKLTGVTKRRMLETLKNGSATKRQKSFDNFDTEEVYKNIVQNMDSEVVTEMECLPDSEVFSQNVEGDVLSPILTNPYSIEDMLDCGNFFM